MHALTDESWAPLREALPSFDQRWREYVARSDYDPSDAGVNAIEFELYLNDVLRADLDAVAPVLAAMERLYSGAHQALRNLLTIGVLEHLINAAEEAGIDLRRLALMLPGPETRAAWREALAWTHPECDWDDSRGLVPRHPPPSVVARFAVSALGPIPDRPAFAVEGEVLEGVIRPGLFAWQRITSGMHDGREIVAVEPLAHAAGVSQMRLAVSYHESEDAEVRPFIASDVYEPGEVLEIIESLPPDERPRDDEASPTGASTPG